MSPSRVYDSFLVNTTEAVLGILFVLALSRQIELHARRLGGPLKYFGNISLIILLFHVPIQGFWGQKIMAITNNLPLSIAIGFIAGVLGPVMIHEIFIRFNPVASFWFGRKADLPEQKELPVNSARSAMPSTPAAAGKQSEQSETLAPDDLLSKSSTSVVNRQSSIINRKS